MAHHQLVARAPVWTLTSLNWLLVSLCVVIVTVTSFFLFYWNRLVGWLFGFMIRFFFWKKQNVWVECEAFQFSFLAGRVLLKDFRYHSRNQSIRVLKCHVTWRYWLWRTKSVENLTANTSAGETTQGSTRELDLPCRIHVVLEGVEWVFYNRTPAFDDIVTEMEANTQDSESVKTASIRPSHAKHSHESSTHPTQASTIGRTMETTPFVQSDARYPPTTVIPSLGPLSKALKNILDWIHTRLPTFNFHDILPISIDAKKCSVIFGNDSTPSIFIGAFETASGTYTVAKSRSAYDPYKSVYNFRLGAVKIITRTNPDHQVSMLERGKGVLSDLKKANNNSDQTPTDMMSLDGFRKLLRLFPDIIRRPTPKPMAKWQGLPRFMSESQRREAGELPHEVEYAKVTTILDTPVLEVVYYVDVPGEVPESPRSLPGGGKDDVDIGNGDLAPEWVVELVLHGGSIDYGPWADRQRDAIQKALFPTVYFDRKATPKLNPGDLRVHSSLKVLLELKEGVTLRLPTREVSKDWKYKATGSRKKEKRPFGWMDIKLASTSSLIYTMSMLANDKAYHNTLDVHLVRPVISSSVNGTEFWSSDSCRITCDLPSPLVWNAERTWTFEIAFNLPLIYLLRDHTTLLTDLIQDWTSGPPTAFNVFVPTIYVLKFSFKQFKINLYVNDHNVIDHPLADETNALMEVTGPSLEAYVLVPSNKYRPFYSTVTFWVEALNGSAAFSLPTWNTHRNFSRSQSISFGQAGVVRLDGSYQSYTEAAEDHVEKLKLDLQARQVVFRSFGWAIRHFLILKDNYFGGFTHFTTLQEYIDKKEGGAIGDPVLEKYRPGAADTFEVTFSVNVQETTVLLPQEIYDCKAAIVIDIPEMLVFLRLHDHFMEMSLNLPPISMTVTDDCEALTKSASPSTNGRLTVDNLAIVANRLFGPLPQTATYVCLWEIQVGVIHGVVSPTFVHGLASAGRAFGFNYSDIINAPAAEFVLPLDPDMTVLELSLQSINVTLNMPRSATVFSLSQGMSVKHSDLAGQLFRSATSIEVPQVEVKSLLGSSSRRGACFEVASFEADVQMDIYSSPAGWQEDARRQALFLQAQDAPTQRVAWAYSNPTNNEPSKHLNSLYIPHPRLPSHRRRSRGLSRRRNAKANVRKSTPPVSDSDDDVLSERERHARLLASRPTLHGSSISDNGELDVEGSFSSGDESDDGGSTSSQRHTDTDMSEDETEGDGPPNWPDLADYRAALARYRRSLVEPVGSGYPSFVIAHEPDWLKWQPSSETGNLPDSPISLPAWNLNTPTEPVSTTIFRIQCGSPIEVFVTPLLVHPIRDMFASYDPYTRTLDHQLDDVACDYLSRATECALSVITRSILDIQIPGFRLTYLEASQVVTEVAAPTLQPGWTDEGLRRLCIGRIDVQRAALLLASTTFPHKPLPSLDISTYAGLVTASLHIHQGVAPPRSDSPFTSIMDISLSPSSLSLSSGQRMAGEIRLGDFGLGLHNASAQTVSSILTSLVRASSKVATTISRSNRRATTQRRLLIQSMLAQPHDKPLSTDPLSWTNASFMVKSGLPRKLRTDLSWRILAHVRHRIRQLTSEQEPSIVQSFEDGAITASQDVMIQLIAAHSDWTQDPDETREDLLLLRVLYPPASVHSLEDIVGGAIQVHTGNITFSVPGREHQHNTLTVGPVFLRLQAERQQFTGTTDSNRSPLPPHMHVIINLTAQHVQLSIFPSVIPFIRHLLPILRGRQTQTPKAHLRPLESPATFQLPQYPIHVDLLLEVHEVALTASALDVAFECRVYNLLVSNNASLVSNRVHNSLVITVDEISFHIKATHNDPRASHELDILAALEVSQFRLHLAVSDDGPKRVMRLVLGSQNLQLSVPKSVVRLNRIIQKSRREYILTYDSMVQDLLAEIEKVPSAPPPTPMPSRLLEFDLQISTQKLGVILQVMHGTWLSWEVFSIVGFSNGSILPTLICENFGVLVSSHIMAVTIKSTRHDENPAYRTPSLRLPMPSLKLTGESTSNGFNIFFGIGYFSLALKPRYMDDILAIQQKFGSDFNDLVDIWADNRQSKLRSGPSPVAEPSPSGLKGTLKLDGLRLALEGPSSTQYLDAGAIEGSLTRAAASSSTDWSISLSSLSLSLAHHTVLPSNKLGFDRKYRSAYMVLDFYAKHHGTSEVQSESTTTGHLSVDINKIHAVMQAAAIGELGDLIDYVQAEMLLRKDQRAGEFAEIKKKTQRVMTSLELEASAPQEKSSWLNNKQITVNVQSVGIAIPLTVVTDVMPSQPIANVAHAFGPSSVKAFLVSIQSIQFLSNQGDTHNAKVQDVSFKFVQQFDQSIPTHFEGKSHDARNRMSFPILSADVKSKTDDGLRQFLSRASVSGFELDLDPSIVNYVFSLIDVYRQGKERIEKLAPGQARANLESLSARVASAQAVGTHYSRATPSHFQGDFEFQSGKVRIFLPETLALDRASRSSIPDLSTGDPMTLSSSDAATNEFGAEEFDLPMLTVWAKFQAASASEKFNAVGDTRPSSTLVINLILHSSHNVLRPSILPFFGELVRHVEARMRQPHDSSPVGAETIDTPISGGTKANENFSDTPLSGLPQLTISLRIDQSNLELTCQPDVNVGAGVHWESGGFVMTMQPGAREFGITGSVAGITAYLRHGYLRSDSLTAEARNLAFSANYSKNSDGAGRLRNSISVVVNTEVSAKVRFARWQDVLCFKAVWLDRIPVFESRPKTDFPSSAVPETPTAPTPGTQPVSVVLLAQIHKVDIEVDLGQAITKLNLSLQSFVIRRQQTRTLSEASLAIGQLELNAVRALSGSLTLPNLQVKTLRRYRRSPSQRGHFGQLEVSISSGPLDLAIDHDQVNLIRFHADPVQAAVHDDWTRLSTSPENSHGIRLDFSVAGGEIMAIGILEAIPTLIGAWGKFRALFRAQKEGAARESKAFRTTLQPKPSNPLSEVASAMLQSARSKLREYEEIEFAIVQHMHFSVAKIQLQVYGRAMSSKLSHFEARSIEAQLERHVRVGDQAPRRDLRLALGSFNVGSFEQGVDRDNLNFKTVGKAGDENYVRIFTLPRMEISMLSTLHLNTDQLDYDFKSDFPDYTASAMAEDAEQGLYVVFNFKEYEELIAVKNRLESDVLSAIAQSKQGGSGSAAGQKSPLEKPGSPSKAAHIETPAPLDNPEDPVTPQTTSVPSTPAEPTFKSPRRASVASTRSSSTQIRSALTKKTTYHALSSHVSTPHLRQTGGTLSIDTVKKFSGVNVKETLPVFVHEYATIPIESIMKVLLEIYARRLKRGRDFQLIVEEDDTGDSISGDTSSGDDEAETHSVGVGENAPPQSQETSQPLQRPPNHEDSATELDTSNQHSNIPVPTTS